VRDGSELGFIFGVRLDAQRGREHELADSSRETGEEGVEGLLGGIVSSVSACD
jgi:hypothetical protein